MGANGDKEMHSFDIEGNGIDFIKKWADCNYSTPFFVHSDNKVICTGGINRSGSPVSTVTELTFSVNRISTILICQQRDLPSLIKPRHSHCSFIQRNHLFVVFGQNLSGGGLYSQTLECLDLKDPQNQFRELPIDGYESYCSNAMIFPKDLCPTNEIFDFTPTIMYYFGG